MSRYRNFTTICCAAVFALGLAACGGGDDGISVADRDAAVAAEQAKTDALQMEINALRAQLGLDPEDDPAASIQDLQDEVARLQGEIDDAADKARMAQEEADRKAMATTAAKLYAGIGMPTTADSTPQNMRRNAAYGTDESQITVTIGGFEDDGTTPTSTPIMLSEDKKTMVADNHGWEGKRYADPAGGDMVEAMVYSNVSDPKQGDMFSKKYDDDLADGVLPATTVGAADSAGLVASPSFDQSAGIKRFPLPQNDPSNPTTVVVPGSFHGVAGTYSCMPGGAVCAVRVADKGFELGTVPSATASTWADGTTAWTFKPADVDARVTEMKDGEYVSYGWWIRKAANDGPFTASAFHDEKGGVPAASGLGELNGKATYMGGAAGKYALASSTGGTNDAGHFTARATLEADFTDNEGANAITGMIDMFMGADGMPRDWSVKLNGSPITDTGGIGDASNGTVWTIGEDAAKASGNWTGLLQNNGTDNVPQVATGTFYTDYGTAGMMVGAFGANKQ